MHYIFPLSLILLISGSTATDFKRRLDPEPRSRFENLARKKKSAPYHENPNFVYVFDYRSPQIIQECNGFLCTGARGQDPAYKYNEKFLKLWGDFDKAYDNTEVYWCKRPGYIYKVNRRGLLGDNERDSILSVGWQDIKSFTPVADSGQYEYRPTEMNEAYQSSPSSQP